MIGQVEVRNQIMQTSARSILISGPAHWGKKTLVRELLRGDESVYELTGNANAFREAVARIHEVVRPTTYFIPDIDKCNATIQNLLLKVLEEPPHAAKFILTASGPVLPTITSRCVTFRMRPYADTQAELGGIAAPPSLLGMFRSPGERALLVEGSEVIAEQLKEIKSMLAQGSSLAAILKYAKNITYQMSEINLSNDGFILIAFHVLGNSSALEWLRSQSTDGVKYIRTLFFMKLWIERQVV